MVELEADRANRSPVRDRLLHEAGYTILRFPMTDAEAGLDAVMATIAKWFGVPLTTNAEIDAMFPTVRAAHPNGFDMGFLV